MIFKNNRGQASLEIMFVFMILLMVSVLLINSMPQLNELKKTNEKIEIFKKNETTRSAFSLGYLIGGIIEFEEKVGCGGSIEIFGEKIDKITCSYNSTGRWFLK